MYPEVELGAVLLAFLMLVVPLHGPRHSIVLLLPLLLLDLHTSNTKQRDAVIHQTHSQCACRQTAE